MSLRKFIPAMLVACLLGAPSFASAGETTRGLPQHATAHEQRAARAATTTWLDDHAFTEGLRTVNGVRLHYVIGGRVGAPSVILIHGWPQSWWEYHRLAPLLAAHYRVLIPDLLGIDGSSQPRHGYTKKRMAQDIHALGRQLDIGKTLVVGHDIGAMVAYSYAAQFPADVRALGILSVPVPDASFTKIPALPVMPNAFRWWFALHNEPGVAERLIDTNLRYYLNNFFDHHDHGRNYRVNDVDGTARQVYLSAYGRPGALHASLLWYRTFLQDALDNEALMQRKLPFPVLGVVDTIDAAGLQGQLPKVSDRSKLSVVPRTGHWLPEQIPGELAHELVALDTSADA